MLKGYDTLCKEQKNLFDKFIVNFEFYGICTPISVYYVEEFVDSIQEGDDFTAVGGKTEIINLDDSRILMDEWSDPDYNQYANHTSSSKFLKFDYTDKRGVTWQRVVGPTEWY